MGKRLPVQDKTVSVMRAEDVFMLAGMMLISYFSPRFISLPFCTQIRLVTIRTHSLTQLLTEESHRKLALSWRIAHGVIIWWARILI